MNASQGRVHPIGAWIARSAAVRKRHSAPVARTGQDLQAAQAGFECAGFQGFQAERFDGT